MKKIKIVNTDRNNFIKILGRGVLENKNTINYQIAIFHDRNHSFRFHWTSICFWSLLLTPHHSITRKKRKKKRLVTKLENSAIDMTRHDDWFSQRAMYIHWSYIIESGTSLQSSLPPCDFQRIRRDLDNHEPYNKEHKVGFNKICLYLLIINASCSSSIIWVEFLVLDGG